MNIKLLAFAALLPLTPVSSAVFAASPFLVNHSSLELAGGRAVEQSVAVQSKATLAETLVQLQHDCDGMNQHQNANRVESVQIEQSVAKLK
jgi:hypothetical protein